jgi:glycine betaine/proline transport system substrate-binding protein
MYCRAIKRWSFILSGLILTIAFLQSVSALHAAQPPESRQPINVIVNDWSSQIVLANIFATVLDSMGYQTRLVPSKVNSQWGALSRGVAHVQVEIWEGTMAKELDRLVAQGSIIDAGSYSAKTREEWWYPDYLEKDCPGLPDWQALKECAELFSVAETFPKGRYLAGPWEKPDEARILALGLNFQIVQLDSGDELGLQLKQAAANKQPILLFNWTPNWIDAVYPGKFIEFPNYSPECESDPAWGVNPKRIYDCGNPKNGWLKKAAWQGMKQTWPCAFETLNNMDLDNLAFAEIASLVDVKLMSVEAAATTWIKNNTEIWQDWIPANCFN